MSPGVLVDTNVLVDVVTDDPRWARWSIDALEMAGRGNRLVINPIIYAEVCVAFDTIEALDELLSRDKNRFSTSFPSVPLISP